MKFHTEEFLSLLRFETPKRQVFAELFGPLVGLEEEWRVQGASDAELSLTAFGWDHVTVADCGAELGFFPLRAPVVIEETLDYTLSIDYLGRTIKLMKEKATIGLPLNYPVKTADDWLKLKPSYEYQPQRVDWDSVERSRRKREAGAIVVATIPGAWETPRELMGDEGACVCYYEQPELMRGIFSRPLRRRLQEPWRPSPNGCRLTFFVHMRTLLASRGPWSALRRFWHSSSPTTLLCGTSSSRVAPRPS